VTPDTSPANVLHYGLPEPASIRVPRHAAHPGLLRNHARSHRRVQGRGGATKRAASIAYAVTQHVARFIDAGQYDEHNDDDFVGISTGLVHILAIWIVATGRPPVSVIGAIEAQLEEFLH